MAVSFTLSRARSGCAFPPLPAILPSRIRGCAGRSWRDRQLYEYVAVFHLGLERAGVLGDKRSVHEAFARRHVEPRAMQGTLDHLAFLEPIGQEGERMRADVVDRVATLAHAEQTDGGRAERLADRLPCAQIGKFAAELPVGHGPLAVPVVRWKAAAIYIDYLKYFKSGACWFLRVGIR